MRAAHNYGAAKQRVRSGAVSGSPTVTAKGKGKPDMMSVQELVKYLLGVVVVVLVVLPLARGTQVDEAVSELYIHI